MPHTPPEIESIWTTPDSVLAQPLIADLARDYDERYEPNDGVPSSAELSRYPSELFDASRGGAFLVLARGDEAVAGGAFMREAGDVSGAVVEVEAVSEAEAEAEVEAEVEAESEAEAEVEAVVEVKRVWTRPDHRRQGLARRVMAELEAEARRRGYTSAHLTTGARQPEALGLYLALGYEPLFDVAGDLEQISYLRFAKPL